MHILYLASWYPKNRTDHVGSFFREQAISLSNRGMKIGVIAPSLYSLRNPFRTWRFSSISDISFDEGVITYRGGGMNWTPRLLHINISRIIKYSIQLFEAYVAEHGLPDIIHVQSMFPAGFAAVKINADYGVPFLIQEHSSAFSQFALSNSVLKKMKIITRAAKACYAVSVAHARAIAANLEEHSDDWKVIPNSVYDDFFTTEEYRPTKEFIFVHVSNMTRNKNVGLLIDAFAEAFPRQLDVRLKIIGNGPEYNKLVRRAERSIAFNRIEFLGTLGRMDVGRQMRASNAFVLSSLHETFGVVLIEGLASGLPVISTRSGGPEDIIDENNGILVANNNINEMKSALKKIYHDYKYYNRHEIREKCRAKYSSFNISAIWEEVYKKIISNKKEKLKS